jgi:hypothetical protein
MESREKAAGCLISGISLKHARDGAENNLVIATACFRRSYSFWFSLFAPQARESLNEHVTV